MRDLQKLLSMMFLIILKLKMQEIESFSPSSPAKYKL